MRAAIPKIKLGSDVNVAAASVEASGALLGAFGDACFKFTVACGTVLAGCGRVIFAVSFLGGAPAAPAGFAAATEPTAYFDVATGVLQFDPVGHNVNIVIFTYNTEVANITGSTPGPFVYPSGTLQNAVSTSAEKKTFPAGTWGLVPTTFPARLAGGITLTNTPSLATTGANSASTNGWFNKPWSFGAVVAPNALSIAEAERNFISNTTTTDIGRQSSSRARASMQSMIFSACARLIMLMS